MRFRYVGLYLLLNGICVMRLAGEPQYTIKDLGDLGFGYSNPVGLNDNGQVVGESSSRPLLYSNGVMQDLGRQGILNNYSVPYGINNSGQVVGAANTNGSFHAAFLYSDGAVQNLGSLGGPDSLAFGINSSGQVVGYSSISVNGPYYAFLYSGGHMQDLGISLPAYAINDSGQIVGGSGYYYRTSFASIPGHAFSYDNGSIQDLGTLGGSFSTALAINNAGQVVGQADTPDGSPHAVLWSNGAAIDLIPSGSGVATSINDSGQIVGYGDAGGFLYSDGVVTNLNSSIVSSPNVFLGQPVAINNLGQILTQSFTVTNNTYSTRAFLLTPVPEPRTWFLMSAALLCAVVWSLIGTFSRKRAHCGFRLS